jgi:hypothetical protein
LVVEDLDVDVVLEALELLFEVLVEVLVELALLDVVVVELEVITMELELVFVDDDPVDVEEAVTVTGGSVPEGAP